MPEHFANLAGVGSEWDTLIEGLLKEAPANLYEAWLARTDAVLLNHILKMTNGNLVQAAKILGIHRSTIRTKINALNISMESFREQGSEESKPDDLP